MHISRFTKHFKPADILLIVTLISISAYILFLNISSSKSEKVQVFLNNELYGAYQLNEDQVIELSPTITVEIKDNQARISKSDCKNQLCVKQGWSDKLPVICVPNRLELKFSDKTDNNSIIKIIK